MYDRIISAALESPWAILPAKLQQIAFFLRVKSAGGKVPEERLAEFKAARRTNPAKQAGRVGVVAVFGVLTQHANGIEETSGAVSAERIGAQVDEFVTDSTVKCIVMAFDSPGGSVLGIGELAEKIRARQAEKPIYGIADSMAASAAYWLAAQCTKLSVTPGGQVGSIGVLAMHEDYSKALEAEGVAVTLVSSGKYKTEQSPYAPLTEDAKAEMQSKCDAYYSAFVSGVAKGRGVAQAKVRSDYGQGRMMTAKDALDNGMIDSIESFEDLMGRLKGDSDSTDDVYRGEKGPPLAARLAAARARSVEVQEQEKWLVKGP